MLRPFALLLASSTCALAEPVIVTDMPVTAAFVAMVTGEDATPTALLAAGADPHHAHLAPSQARDLSNADLVVWMSPDLTPWLTDAVPDQAISLTLAAPDEADPHIWLDPAQVRTAIVSISAQLAKIDPENASVYAENEAAALVEIEAIGADMAEILRPHADVPFIVAHDAYHHLEEAFDLAIVGAVADSHAASPGAKRISDLEDVIQSEGVVCVFSEPQHGDKHVEAVASDNGLRMGELDALGADIEAGPTFYRTLMINLAEDIADCLADAPPT